MRHVKIPEDAQPDQDWLKKSADLTRQLEAASSHEERQEIIKRNEGHWRNDAFRQWMMALFHHKCWYSEAAGGASTLQVEHFRPKGKVKEGGQEYEGYWWKAFDWTNYRMAASTLNQKKANRFPLMSSIRATGSDRLEEHESPALLDPLEEDDVALVSYSSLGDLVPAPGTNDDQKQRIDITCTVLGLNQSHTIREERKKKWFDCQMEITRFAQAMNDPSFNAKLTRAQSVKELEKLLDETRSYSGVAVACIDKHAPRDLRRRLYNR